MGSLGIKQKQDALPTHALATCGRFGIRNSPADPRAILDQLFCCTLVPASLWCREKSEAVGIEHNLRLFDGKTKLTLVA